MKKLLLLVLFLLSLCCSAFAESLDDVLKDCRLDQSRWKVVEWFKSEQFVRFYDSSSLGVTGPGQFDVITCDYFYGPECSVANCRIRGTKHYHSEKASFNTGAATKTLKYFDTKDAEEKMVDSFALSSSLQIADSIKRKSVDDKTMGKLKELLKNDKKFAAEALKQTGTSSRTNITGFAPLPRPIGSKDGEWIYLGRFVGSSNILKLQNIMQMNPYDSRAERDGVFDVYYFHSHNASNDRTSGLGCHVTYFGNNAKNRLFYYYACILKFVPLDRHGTRIQRNGVNTELVSMNVTAKGAYGVGISQVRKYDTASHNLVQTITVQGRSDVNDTPLGFVYSPEKQAGSPFWRAAFHSQCPHQPGFG